MPNVKNFFFFTLAIFVFSGMALSGCSQSKEVLSNHSIAALKSLNEKYALEMKEIDSEGNDLKKQLLSANLIKKPTKNAPQGFILSFATKKEDDYFTLSPKSTLSEGEMKKIVDEYKKIPEVKGVEIDQKIVLFENTTKSLNLKSNSGEEGGEEKKEELSKKVVKVAILDSGLDADHEAFKNVTIQPGWNGIDKNQNTEDDLGHGTHIAGIIAQSKAPIELIPYKVINKESGGLSHVISTLKKIKDSEKVDVINMSFGFEKDSAILQDLLQQERERGAIIVVAAGNEGVEKPVYPAAYKDVVAVGAVNAIGRTLSNSNYGSWIDVAAQGHYLNSTLPNNQYGHKSGTSQAAAKVSAYLTELISEKQTMDLGQFLNVLEQKKTKVKWGNLQGISMI